MKGVTNKEAGKDNNREVMPLRAHLKVERNQQKPANGSNERPRLSEPESRSGPTTRKEQ